MVGRESFGLVTCRVTMENETSSPCKQTTSDISCLYPEILALIFSYLNVRDKGRAAQVCAAWREAAYHKSVWRGVRARLHLRRANPSLFPSLVRRGIRRIQVLSLRRSLRDVVLGVPNLKSLNLMGCYNLSDPWVSHALVHDMPALTELNLSMCKQITDSSLGRIAQHLQYLEYLDLAGCCNITNTGLLLVAWGLRRLRSLNLRSLRHVSDTGIGHLAGLTPEAVDGTVALEHLGLQDCQKLTDVALRHVSLGLHQLKSINLSFCASVTDSGLKYLARMSELRELNLSSCDNITDLGMIYLAEGGSRLTSLDVSFCDKVGDQGLLHISQGLFNLQSLSLNACPISDEGVSRIARTLSDLQSLNIGQCSRVTDKGLSLIADRFHQLHSIDLYGCTKITTVGLEKVMQLPCLSVLNLGLWRKEDTRLSQSRSKDPGVRLPCVSEPPAAY
ncbi:F-box/LRR-repeat protein 14-like [Limulus polyphemus]|uniref:F-box/LRR-repeat protein 14-like n=1 Tax=Limulus polyphemus TaxID=6850 RepID=A0ABM1RUE2_LIMPO|nr:F-box/LRR-repeat protein 14-like [Limulus polyphemus]